MNLLLTNPARPAILPSVKLTFQVQQRLLFEDHRVLPVTDLREQVSEGLFVCLREKTFKQTKPRL